MTSGTVKPDILILSRNPYTLTDFCSQRREGEKNKIKYNGATPFYPYLSQIETTARILNESGRKRLKPILQNLMLPQFLKFTLTEIENGIA